MKAIPEGFSTITPTLILEEADKAIALYKKALNATELYRMQGTDGRIMHACLEIGNSKLFLCDTNPAMGCAAPSASSFYVYMENVDSQFSQATVAGMKTVNEVQDMFWGDRVGCVEDTFGIRWTLATHVRDVSPEEMQEAQKNWGKAA